MAVELFLSLCKPDCVRLNLVGEVISRFEQRGLKLVYLKWMQATPEQITSFYLDRADYGGFDELLDYMTSGPIVMSLWEGEDANNRGRQTVGNKEPTDSSPGSIRGSLPAVSKIVNIVHGSRSPEEALAETAILAPELGIGEPVPAMDRPTADAPFAPEELAYDPERDGWDGRGEPVNTKTPRLADRSWEEELIGKW